MDYIVRHAAVTDVDRLWELEELCWRHTRTPKAQLLSRVQTYPQGQLVLEQAGKVLGVIYSQRIAAVAAIELRTATDVHELHDESGSIIQLLALNVDPQAQNAGYGDQLLEYMLQHCSQVPGVERVVGVTLCKSYDAASGQPFDEYIREAQDPVLAFHWAHGADIVKAVPGYRPEDQANLHNGVLISYDIRNRVPRRQVAAEAAKFDAQQVRQFVAAEAARLLAIGESEIDVERPVMEMGLDSADLLILQRRCEEQFGRQLQSGFFFHYNTIAKVARHLAPAAEPATAGTIAEKTSGASGDIAVIGMSCKLPGGIESPDQLWQVLAAGECVISTFPASRRQWPSATDFPGIEQGGFVASAEAFDAAFFRISPAEARITDPQQRMLLQLAWACLEDAGIVPAEWKGSNTGVFVGASNSDYSRLVQEAGLEVGANHGIGSSLAILANRISYFYDFSGPSFVIDTACSSSLVALHSAIQSLRSGECSSALVGGVNLICHPDLSLAYHKAGMLASDGRCKVFDANADGYVRSEGAVVLMLKPLQAAIADGNQVHAVIRGSAINHGGLAGGLTVPNPQKQNELLVAAWKDAGIHSNELTYIEAHGTGTPLGDPIELQGIQAAHAQMAATGSAATCAIGSIKSNVGHLESAAGITGLLKIILSLRHRQLPASVNFTKLNPKIQLDGTPFVIQDRLRAWDAQQPRIAGVSSFGSGGANAHVVVQEYTGDVSTGASENDHVFVLSAATPDRLRESVANAAQWLERAGANANFADAIFTWQTGRAAMKHRLAVRVSDRAELLSRLQAWLAGNGNDVWTGQPGQSDSTTNRVWQTKSGRTLIEQALAGRDLELLGTLWVTGTEIDWRKCHSGQRRIVSLPVYPFAQERYWIDVAPKKVEAAAPAPVAAVLHPLLHTNTSDLSQQSYSTTFIGDQQVSEAVCLDMARVAVTHALPERPEAVELRDVVWGQPIIVKGEKQVSIALIENDRGEVEFEIYSGDDVVHCHGRAVPGARTEQKKPSGITLTKPAAVTKPAARAKASITLAAPAAPASDVVSIRFESVAQLVQALDKARNDASIKAVTVSGFERLENHDVTLYRALVSFPYPIIAVLQNDAKGAGFLAASLCDFMVGNEDASYASPESFPLLAERFGATLANDFVYVSPVATGRELRAKGWTCPFVPAARVEAHAAELAATLATKSRDALRLMKQHMVRNLAPLVDELTPIESAEAVSHADVLVVTSASDLRGNHKAIVVTGDAVSQLSRLIAESDVPVVAALTGDARGEAWLAGQLCDAVVYSRTATYSAANLGAEAAAIFTRRMGNAAKEILLTGADYSGAQLQQRAGTLLVTESEQVLAKAIDVAASLAKFPRVKPAVPALSTPAQDDEIAASLPAVPTQIELQTNVVTATAHPEGIVVVKMEDRDAKNMFSVALMDGLAEAFAHIGRTPGYKVVVLTGYDSYFASGGTREILLAIQEGKAKFTDFTVFQAPLDCELPVISAMQGHGIGAGWSTGMFADLVLLSDESRYVSPYMNFGFTPGAGSTWVLADKLGQDLARESLLTGQQVSGSELKDRGLKLPILPRAGVVDAAMELARLIARTPRTTLIGLKQQWTAPVREPLAETYRRELAMHEQTFVGRADTLALIENSFQQDSETPAEAPVETPVETALVSIDSEALPELTATLKTLLANELQMRENDLDENTQFVDMGLDSISGVTWVRKINEKYRTSIDATKVYKHPTLAEFSRFVKAEAEKQGTLPAPFAPRVTAPVKAAPVKIAPPKITVAPPVEKAPSRRKRASRFLASASAHSPFQPIAVIGMAGQFPQAKNLDEFWQNLAEGRNCITEVPRERWDVDSYYQPGEPVAGKTTSRWAGVIEEYDLFDPLFFNISPTEAVAMDPQQRLFLEACWHSIESAGYDPRALSGSRCGVFAGCTTGDYHQLSRPHELSAQGFTGNAISILAARISYFLNLQGPCVSIDTACSSSLVALAQACESLASGASDLALSGGVWVMAGPQMHIKAAQAGMLSPEGKCFTFDQRADGFVPGEGVGVVLLKRLADAERDGDIIYGLVEGWGVNQDGKTNGITAPNPESQTRLEQEVYDRFRIDPAGIQLIEAHGTGTKLGDPIEIEGLREAFRKYTRNEQYCAIGSVKSNIGHCLWAAGIAGFLKLMLALKHRQLPPTIHFDQLNEHIDLSGSPFYVNDRLQDWTLRGAERRQAAVSSFAFSGTNAHLVVGEYLQTAAVQRPVQPAKVIVPLSARTAAQLRQKAIDLLGAIQNEPATNLLDLAYTLQAGREAMDERVGFIIGSLDQLAEKLSAYIAGESLKDVYQGQVNRGKESIRIISQDDEMRDTVVDKCIATGRFAKLLDFWVKGLNLDWNKLYGEIKPRRIALPVYPFAKERYWIDAPAAMATHGAATAVLHPLLHANTSDLTEQRYSSTFTGEEFFFADHRVRTENSVQKILPGVAYLEMARAAIEQALPARPEGMVLELQNTVWAQPIIVDGNRQIHITLIANDDDQIDFEIHSEDGVHCEGTAVWSQPAPAMLDLAQLAGQDAVAGSSVYAAFVRMGLLHGPAFQGVRSIEQSSTQLLSHLRLPESIRDTVRDYVLHPSLMDSALQGYMGLVEGWFGESSRTRLPFALEMLRIFAPCEAEMVAWVRFAHGSHAGDPVVKMDVDLCDVHGNVCVQMHGFSSRLFSKDDHAGSALVATPGWQAEALGTTARTFAERHVLRCHVADLDAQSYSEFALSCFERVQNILRGKPHGDVLLQVVASDARIAGLSGLLATAAQENPRFHGQIVIGTEAENLLEDEQTRGRDSVVRYERGARQVLRWQEVAPAVQSPVAFKDDGVYLITGGLGSLGVLFAKEILDKTGDARVILTGRSAKTLEGVLAQSGRVTYRQVDMEDLAQVEQLVRETGRLDGVLHSAGMTADNFIVKKDAAEFRSVLAPKVTGTGNLDRATREAKLDFFVLFSSIAGALGNAGQADYAAANGFLDQFAAHRNREVAAGRRQGRTLSINWGLWRDGGMSLDATSREVLLQNTGIGAMQTATAMAAFHRSLALSCDRTLIAEGDLARLRRTLLTSASSAARVELVPADLDADSLFEKTQTYLRRQFSELLTLPSQNIDPQAALEKYGVDSILAMKLTHQLEKSFGSLSKTLFFEYQTIRELTGYFVAHYAKALSALFATSIETAPQAVTPAQPRSTPVRRFTRSRNVAPARPADDDPIAIVGLSGRYPQALDLEAYWENLRDGKDCIVEVPEARWSWQEYLSDDRTKGGHHYSKWGGFIDGVEEFDPLFFNISPMEAELIDPQERLFLQHSWMAMEDAGYTRATIRAPHGQDLLPGQVGVYAGVWCNEYQLFGAEASLRGRRQGISVSIASIANRVSYALNIHGPSMTVDTMCSSSLTAIHYACQDLKLGRISMAIAGGVNVNIHPNKYLMLSAAQAISSDGRCQSFGEGGDGYIPAEGVGVVVLKRLSDAERDGDHIYGVIRGSALNHGGKTNGYTVPNPQAQTSAVSRALVEAKVDARHVSYIETHGTGTKLGDPIEIAALSRAFQQYTQDTTFCPIGSVKSNIGHCESAAGVAGLTKVLLQMQHRLLVPSLHSTQLNPHIEFDRTPFVVNQAVRPWEQPVVEGRVLPRIAGISSFGAGGSNAHVVVEEYQAVAQAPLAFTKVAIVLSARTTAQLQQKAQDFLAFLNRQNSVDLAAVAYTLQTGREGMDERLGFVVGSTEELIEKLQAYVAGRHDLDDVFAGSVKRNKEALAVFGLDADLQQTIDKWIANRKLSRIVDLWVKGLELDWIKLYGEVKPRRVSLPVYPFARERYWIDAGAGELVATTRSAALHPLLHTNTSDLNGQRFSSTFTGNEFFFSDHRVKNDKVLPGVAYLEMARAAIEQALPERPEGAVLELHNTVWLQPVVVTHGKRVDIRLRPDDEGRIEYVVASGETIHCQGRAVLSARPAAERIDLAQLESRMPETVTADTVYAACARMGLMYGPAFRSITGIRQGSHELLAHLRLPATVQPAEYVLHPSVMDGALQSCVGLLEGWSGDQGRMPFALDSVHILAPCKAEMVAWVRDAEGKIDIDLCDAQGRVCVRMVGFAAFPMERPKTAQVPVGLLTLAPVWDAVQVEAGPLRPAAGERVLVVGGDEKQHRELAHACPGAELVKIDKLHGGRRIDHVVWMLPSTRDLSIDGEAFIEAQEDGVLAGFRLIKTLIAEGYGHADLGWTVISNGDVAHAGVDGLIGSMAREYANWKVRFLDVEGEVWPWSEILRLPSDDRGDCWTHRGGQWLRRHLVECALNESAQSAYKRNGVYVVIGGAGGIGEVLSEYLVRTHDARIAWIGRREKDATIEQKQERIVASGGEEPLYIAADARKREDLERASKEIKKRFGRIDGVIHSAIVLADKSLAAMSEEQFRSALSAKVDVAVRIAQVFGREPLDFVLYFSSVQTFVKAPGQSNYAAGCTFTDAFAEWQSVRADFATKVMNWGYWGSVGLVATAEYQERMRQLGIGSLEVEEGMAGLESLLSGTLNQVAMIRTHGTEAARALRLTAGETLSTANQEAPAVCERLPQPAIVTEPHWAEQRTSLDSILVKLLRVRMAEAGSGVIGHYERWLQETHRILAANAGDDGAEQVAAEWEREKVRLSSGGMTAHVNLVDATLDNLVDILRGGKRATDVIFPGSSLSLVEGIYKNHAVADFFNGVMARVVSGYVEECRNENSDAQLRLIELGAGTGGSSQGILRQLDAYRANVAEYCYTDLSKVFLVHGEKAYGADREYLKYALLNVEKSLAPQEIERGAYDVVLATNVLHATRRMRDTVRNAKAALKKNGVLVLNEFGTKTVFAHLTFGLLEGWWAYEDAELRMEGSPGLTPESWQQLLESEGFRNVRFPAEEAHALGQQIIVAESDGVFRQKQTVAAKPARKRAAAAPVAPVSIAAAPVAMFPVAAAPVVMRTVEAPEAPADLKDKVEQWLVEAVGVLLKVRKDDVDVDVELSEFGFDSISLTGFANHVNQTFGLSVMPTIFYEHATVRAFAKHLIEKHAQPLAEKLVGSRPVAAPPPVAIPAIAVPVAATPAVRESGLAEKAEQWLADAVCTLLKVRKDDVDVDAELSEFGFDSISLTGLANHVNQAFGLSIMPTIFYEHATVRSFAKHLVAKHAEPLAAKLATPVRVVVAPLVVSVPAPMLVPVPAPGAAVHVTPASRPAAVEPSAVHAGSDAIAIIGMSGRFPGAKDLDGFWENLAAGVASIREIPADRWDWRGLEADGSGVKWGAFIEGVDEFDPLFFGISPREAELIDPQQRLLLMYGWKAFEDAGYGPRQLWGSRTGVFVGTASTGYNELLLSRGRASIEGYSAAGVVPSVGPNRLSYMLNLHGPSEPIETACSSALVAVHRAVRSMLDGDCEMALVGGVNTLVTPASHISFSKAGMLSKDGKCKTFSSRADGYVRGEGVGMVVLKRLGAAERDGDHIYAVIRGSAENHGGRAQSLTAPNPQAQAELIKDAHRRAGVSPRSITYIEAHGTGTSLGDPIEINGLKSAFESLYEETSTTPATGYCALGSVKSNIGHLELAAGVAGLIKVILQMRHKTLAPSLHCEELNPYIRLEDSPFYVVREKQPWLPAQSGQPLRAGISSFGFGGVNAHIVVEEYIGAPAVKADAIAPVAIVLSARDGERLREHAAQLRQAVAGMSDGELVSLAYTLQVGREAMEHRLAFAASSIAELREKLDQFLAGKTAVEGLSHGEAKRNSETLAVFRDEEMREAVDKWLRRGKWAKLLELWVQGLDLEWELAYGDDKPRRVSLPTYPFARERCWVDTTASAVAEPATARLHPLLHRNLSDLGGSRYASTFTGEEFFLADHRVRTDGHSLHKVLPGVACLEMARAAMEQASPEHLRTAVLELHDTVWLQPVVVTEPKEVSITLSQDGEHVAFEIHSADAVHCHGHAVFSHESAPERVDLDELRARTSRSAVDPADLYAMFDAMGLAYGPALRRVAAIRTGENELLAQLTLPDTLDASERRYVLHPSLLDGALQAALTLIVDVKRAPGSPIVPFGVETVRVFAPCTREMFVWASRTGDVTLDIDLCDASGNVCVQLHGVAARQLDSAPAAALNPRNLPITKQDESFDDEFYRKLIEDIASSEVSIDEAVELG